MTAPKIREYNPLDHDSYLPRIDRYRDGIIRELHEMQERNRRTSHIDQEYDAEIDLTVSILDRYPKFTLSVLGMLEDERKDYKVQESFRLMNAIAWRFATAAGEKADWNMDALTMRLLARDYQGESTVEENSEKALERLTASIPDGFEANQNYVGVLMHPLGSKTSPVFWDGTRNAVLLSREIPETVKGAIVDMPIEKVVEIAVLNGLELTVAGTETCKIKLKQREGRKPLGMKQAALIVKGNKLMTVENPS